MSFTPYQIDYTVKNTSKTFGFSKKRVSFKFGIANREAIGQGLTGANCRGSEHEIILIWSLNSGKRQILADGKDVHYSETGQNGWTTDQVFQHHFNLRVPNFSTPLRCHLVTQPANRDVPSIHPFDIRLNGVSYFSFAKIFQLGTPQMISRPLKGSRGQQIHGVRDTGLEDDAYVTPEERKAIAAAKLASLKDLEQKNGPNRDEGNLINLLDDPAPPPTPSPSAASAPYGQPAYSNYALPPGAAASQAPSYASAPSPQSAYGAPSPQPGGFAPAPPAAVDPFAAAAMAPYQQPPTPQGYYGAPPPFGSPPPNGMMSPSAQSYASYGSAPTFAQPPPGAQPPQYQQSPPQYQQPPQPGWP